MAHGSWEISRRLGFRRHSSRLENIKKTFDCFEGLALPGHFHKVELIYSFSLKNCLALRKHLEMTLYAAGIANLLNASGSSNSDQNGRYRYLTGTDPVLGGNRNPVQVLCKFIWPRIHKVGFWALLVWNLTFCNDRHYYITASRIDTVLLL